MRPPTKRKGRAQKDSHESKSALNTQAEATVPFRGTFRRGVRTFLIDISCGKRKAAPRPQRRWWLLDNHRKPIRNRDCGHSTKYDRICEFRSLTRSHPTPWSGRMVWTCQRLSFR
jgi:hypothetical protein